MFARSLDLVDECGLTHLHVFPFSPRPGTPAARMPQVDRARRQGARAAVCARRARRRCARISMARSARAAACWPNPTRSAAPSSSCAVRLAAPVEPGVILDLDIAAHDGRQLLAA